MIEKEVVSVQTKSEEKQIAKENDILTAQI